MLEKISIIGINKQLILMDHCWPLVFLFFVLIRGLKESGLCLLREIIVSR